MNSFEEREKERTAEQYRQLAQNAEIENAAIDDADELLQELETYLHQKSLRVTLVRAENVITLTREDARVLRVSTHDHQTYEVMGVSPSMDQLRRTYLSRIVKRQMMDEVLTWLSASCQGNY